MFLYSVASYYKLISFVSIMWFRPKVKKKKNHLYFCMSYFLFVFFTFIFFFFVTLSYFYYHHGYFISPLAIILKIFSICISGFHLLRIKHHFYISFHKETHTSDLFLHLFSLSINLFILGWWRLVTAFKNF